MAARQYSERYQKIWRTVAAVPAGKVATYGQIAELSGIPRGARQVGYALHRTPEGLDLPWHRIINARGEISFPRASSAYRRQRDRLTAEGVVFIAGRVDLSVYGWRAESRTESSSHTSALDELLWKPADAEHHD